MNCFQLIKTVLDEAFAEIPGADAEKDAAVTKQCNSLTSQYKKLTTKGCLDYSDPARRFAYLFTYTTSHANVVFQRIAASEALKKVLAKPQVTLSCIGGGPGSDFLGVLKYCESAGLKPSITCHLLDRDSAWGESWSDVGCKMASTMALATVFSPFDVTDPAKWRTFKKHLQADLFTLIYFVSEVYQFRDKACLYFDELFSTMKPGAKMLFVDNNSNVFYDWFDEMASKHGMKVLESGNGVMKMPRHERTDDLEPYKSRLKWNPKLDADIAWRVLRK